MAGRSQPLQVGNVCWLSRKQNANTVRRELCRGVVTSICKEDGGEEDVVYIQSRRAPVLTVRVS